MRKFLCVLAVISLVFIGCDDLFEASLKIVNNTDYTLSNVIYDSFHYGTIEKGKSVNKSSSLMMSSINPWGKIYFYLSTPDGDVECWTDKLDLDTPGKNEFIFFNGTVANYGSENSKASIQSIAGPMRSATLNVSNLSDYNLLNVEYDTVSFGNLNSGKSESKAVVTGTKYLFFEVLTNYGNKRFRTNAIILEDNQSESLTITNNTVVTLIGEGTSAGLKSLIDGLNN